jgi:hypothetical protein
MTISILAPRTQSNPAHTQEIKQWIRAVFQLSDDVTVMVTELQCSEPGCPPVETVIAIMNTGRDPSRYKLHKAIRDVTAEDIRELRKGGAV